MFLYFATISVSILITSVLNCASSLLSFIFPGTLICSFIWAIFLCLGACSKGQSLRYSPGWGNPSLCIVVLHVPQHSCGPGMVQEGAVAFARLSAGFQYFPHYPPVNWVIWCRFLGGWTCICSRTPWVSPLIFTARSFEALFPHAATLDCTICPQLFLPVYPLTNVGLPSLPAAVLLGVLSTLAACLCPSYWSE